MAGSPQCSVKISYRKQQHQHQQQTKRAINQSTTTTYLPSPARLYSNVLKLMSSNINPPIHVTDSLQSSTCQQTDPLSAIIQTIKDEIGKSQTILLERLIQLEHKCEVATQQQLRSQHMIKTEITPFLMSISDLIVNVYDTLVTIQVLSLTDQQQTKLSHVRKLATIYPTQSSPPQCLPLSRTQAQPNLCSSLTSISNQPQAASIPSESNFDENLFSTNTCI